MAPERPVKEYGVHVVCGQGEGPQGWDIYSRVTPSRVGGRVDHKEGSRCNTMVLNAHPPYTHECCSAWYLYTVLLYELANQYIDNAMPSDPFNKRPETDYRNAAPLSIIS